MNRGKLISFEGIDGAGKSTQISLLKDFYKSQNTPVVVYREPGGTDVSEGIRSMLLNPKYDMNTMTEFLLFSSARSQLVGENILPDLAEGKLVILDRFYDSSVAYQGYGRGMDIKKIHQINEYASHGRAPDATFYLRISLEEAEKRMNRVTKDRMELAGDDFFGRVYHGFETIAKENSQRVHTIDALADVDSIHADLVQRVNTLYSHNGE